MANGYDGSVVIRAEIDHTAVDTGLASLKKSLTTFSGYANTMMTKLRSITANASSVMSQTARKLGASLETGISSGSGAAVTAMRSVLAKTLSAASGYTGNFRSVGRYIVSGIVSGINESASSVSGAVSALCAEALAQMKEELGIQSPSRVMRDEVGVNIGRGVRDGILSEVDAVGDASAVLGDAARIGAGGISAVSAGMRSSAAYGGDAVRSAVTAKTVQATPSVSSEPRGRREGNTSNTFVFNSPVETPSAHARAIRRTMEEMLYGI